MVVDVSRIGSDLGLPAAPLLAYMGRKIVNCVLRNFGCSQTLLRFKKDGQEYGKAYTHHEWKMAGVWGSDDYSSARVSLFFHYVCMRVSPFAVVGNWGILTSIMFQINDMLIHICLKHTGTVFLRWSAYPVVLLLLFRSPLSFCWGSQPFCWESREMGPEQFMKSNW